MSTLADSGDPPIWRVVAPPLLLAFVLWSTFILKLHNLDHTELTRWDEVFHANVAQNVMKHPVEPTLVDHPYLPFDTKKWGENHVWLHKPILPFWQIALSFALFGVNTFALRLPSAIFSTAAAGVTYLIGCELFDRRTAIITATLQAVNPFLVTLIQGYQFADNIDISLLFWTELGVYFLIRSLRTGSWPSLLLAGWMQGLAFLCKSYLAFIILGIALVAWLLPCLRIGKRDQLQIVPIRLIALVGITILTVLPWLLFCMLHYPVEFWYEHAQVWRHLNTNMEGWAGPWDRVVFDYLIGIYGVFYTPMLVASLVLLGKTFVRTHIGLWLMYAWGLGALVPHLFAETKTPSATLLAIPPLLMLLGHLIAEASRGERTPLLALAAILCFSLAMPARIIEPGYGYPLSQSFGAIMFRATWVLYHVFGSLMILAIATLVCWLTSLRHRSMVRYVHWTAQMICGCLLIWFGIQTIQAIWNVTSRDMNDPVSVEIGQFARTHLPGNAVFLCDEPKQYEHLKLMFYADRTCYPLRGQPNELAEQIDAAGGVPYFITRRRLSFPAVYSSRNQGPTVFKWKRDVP